MTVAVNDSTKRKLYIGLGIIGLFGIITIAFTAATLGVLNKRLDAVESRLPSPTTSPLPYSVLSTTINIEEILGYLKELQNIATTSNGNRAINTPGFNRTLDYITGVLATHTNLRVNKTFFSVRDFALASNPILISSIDGRIKNHTYSFDPAAAEFLHVKYSTPSDIIQVYELTVIPNGGCTEDDWRNASRPTNGRVALVKRAGACVSADRAAHGSMFNVSGILFYNSGTPSENLSPIEVRLGQDNALPALFLSYNAGQALEIAALNTSITVTVQLGIDLQNSPDFPVGNICADTPTGDATQTIVIGSHSDSVSAGAGINDNGSGSAANLGLAIALARLFQTSTYDKYKYRVRFCWWGAEEVGLLGAKDHVKQANSSLVSGERLDDYLINLNYDMLGSPNYIFGIYDGRTANNATPAKARPGSNKITDLFIGWFNQQNLPWTSIEFNGRSDYRPFLAAGIVAGGLVSGEDDIKTQKERDYYDKMLGQGMGGIVGATHDPCYHKACDTIQNINVFAYQKMVQAAAYVLEFLARQDNLKEWLYPSRNI